MINNGPALGGSGAQSREEYERLNLNLTERGNWRYYAKEAGQGHGLGQIYGNGQQFPAGPVQAYTPMRADPSVIR